MLVLFRMEDIRLFILFAFFCLFLHLLDLGGKLLVLLTLAVQVVEIERVDDVLLLEDELLQNGENQIIALEKYLSKKEQEIKLNYLELRILTGPGVHGYHKNLVILN